MIGERYPFTFTANMVIDLTPPDVRAIVEKWKAHETVLDIEVNGNVESARLGSINIVGDKAYATMGVPGLIRVNAYGKDGSVLCLKINEEA